MSSYFDNLVLDVTYLIISYLDKPADLNKLINCSESLKARFQEDDAWKTMFYHNIKNPQVNQDILYRDNYYTNMNSISKYDINEHDDYKYLIVSVKNFRSPSLEEFLSGNYSDPFGYCDNLKFITNHGKIEYINDFEYNTVLNILSEILTDSTIYMGFDLSLTYFDLNDFFRDMFSAGYNITKTFRIDNVSFGYKSCWSMDLNSV